MAHIYYNIREEKITRWSQLKKSIKWQMGRSLTVYALLSYFIQVILINGSKSIRTKISPQKALQKVKRQDKENGMK